MITVNELIVTLTQLTGLPASILDDRQRLDLKGLREFFEKRVLGQPEAVDCLVDRVAMIKAGVGDPSRPQGVFLFVGPYGYRQDRDCQGPQRVSFRFFDSA